MTAITYYFVGGEREAFIAGSNSAITWTTTAGWFDANFSRGGVRLATTVTSSIYIDCPLSSPQVECYCGLMARIDAGVNGPNSANYFTFVNTSLVSMYRVMGISGTTTQPLVQFQYWSGSAWVAIGPGRVIPTDILHKWDFEFFIDDSAGFARCYVDGVLLGELTGDTKFITPYEISEMRIHPPANAAITGVTVSEVMILDTPTLGRRLATLAITGAGATNTLTTGTYADFDDVGTYSDTDFGSSDAAGQLVTAVTSDLSAVAQTYLVDGVVLAYRAQKGGTGPQNLKGVIRIGGTDYESASAVPTLATSFGYTWIDYATNPATSSDFTPTEINTAGFETGYKSAA